MQMAVYPFMHSLKASFIEVEDHMIEDIPNFWKSLQGGNLRWYLGKATC